MFTNSGKHSILKGENILYVLNVFIDIQTSKELIQMDTDKMMTYGTFTMDDEKLTQSWFNTTELAV